MLGIPHPYLTAALPGIGGTIKQTPQDFVVAEVPLYRPSGTGEHVFFELEKVDLSTFEALERLGRELQVDPKEFGYAGLKDRKGVTRQLFSVAHVELSRIESLDLPQMRVLWALRHSNKLRVGHLRGNRFQVWIRGVPPGCEPRIEAILRVLTEMGVPNYYGPQRFGNRGDAHHVGRAFLQGDDRAAVHRILGFPASTEQNPHVVRARESFMAGDLAQSLALFPPTYREERRMLAYLLRAGDNYGGAVRRIREVTRRLYCSAYQAHLFNIVLARRLARTGGDLTAVFDGDVAYLHRNGAVFRVTDIEDAQARIRTFEISPSGPIFGLKMLVAEGVEGEIEEETLGREGVRAADFHQLTPKLHLEGGRRPFRVRAEDLVWKLEGEDLRMEFFLPRGSYATTLLRELMKNEQVPEAFYEDGEQAKHGLWRHPAPPESPQAGSSEGASPEATPAADPEPYVLPEAEPGPC